MTFPDTTFVPGTTITSNWLNAVNDYCVESNPADHSSANIQYEPAGTEAVATTVQAKLRQVVSVKDFGAVGDNVTDDTAAIQAALDYAAAGSIAPDGTTGDITVVFPQGKYRVTSIIVGNRTNLNFQGGVLAPLAPLGSNTYDYLVKIAGHSLTVSNMTIDMEFSLVYDCAVWVRNRHITFNSCNIWKCKSGWVVGDPAWENDPDSGTLGDSENVFSNCATIWAINGIRCYGQNTIIFVTDGSLIYSYKAAIPSNHPNYAAWMALPVNTFVNCGAIIYIIGSSTCNFSSTDAIYLSKLQPVNAAQYYNRFGQYVVEGTHIESGKFLYTSPSTYTAEDLKTGLLTLINCYGYGANSGATWYIDAGGNCAQKILVKDCNFYGGTQSRIAYSLKAPVSIDDHSFVNADSSLYNQGINAAYQYNKSGAVVINSFNSSQAFNSATYTTLITTQNYTSDVSTAYQWINNSTGAITIKSNIKNLNIDVGLYFTGGIATDETSIYIDVNNVAATPVRGGYGPAVNAQFQLYNLAAGDVVKVKVKNSGNRSTDSSPANRIYISGNI